MPQITKEEYIRRALNFVEAHKDSYTPSELEYIRTNCELSIDKPYTSDLLRQLYTEVGMLEKDKNMYEGFLKLLEENFDINTNIIEIGGGLIPSLAKKIALRQKSGTVTVYDPRLITDIAHPDNLVLKREKFSENTPIGDATIIIGFMPCDATNLLIDVACKNKKDFMVALCEGGMRKGYEWLEEDDEWIDFIKCRASIGVKEQNMGVLGECSLEKYHNPYPIIYNKKRKS